MGDALLVLSGACLGSLWMNLYWMHQMDKYAKTILRKLMEERDAE